MRRVYGLLVCYVLCVLIELATARISGRPCNCTNGIMDCSYRRKSQVYPGEMCSNATEANFEQNNLNDYPDGLKSFTSVDVASNLLTRLPNITHLNANIVFLDLSQNRIVNESNELRQFSSLKILRVQDNLLKSLRFLPEPCFIEIFNADNNLITDLQGPLRFCTQMRKIDLDGNLLTMIPTNIFVGMAQLTVLSLNDNPLLALADDVFRGPFKLRSLYLSGTNITTLPKRLFSGTPELRILYLNRNRLRDFPTQQISGLALLQELRIWGNHITELPTLRNCCSQLQEVIIDFNRVSEPSEEAVLSFVRRNASTLSLLRNPLRPTALRWVLSARALQPFVREDDCACGGLRRRQPGGRMAVVWCVNVHCGPATLFADWVAAINNSSAP